MTKKNILCIVEGEKTEVQILRKLNKAFIDKNIDFLPICTNIYHLYHTYLKEKQEIGDDIDIFIFIKSKYDSENVLSDKRKNDFLSIYLFMDLDRHEPLAEQYLECIPDMLRLFNNETENGKLYISYPMVEAFQHPIANTTIYDLKDNDNYKNGKSYKKLITSIRPKELSGISFIEKSYLTKHLIQHIKQANFLLTHHHDYPIYYQDFQNHFEQLNIYQHQNLNYICNAKVVVLSPFALFLLEYLGKPLFDDWNILANSTKV